MGFTKTPQQLQAYEEAERAGAAEAPYNKPPGSPRRQPTRHQTESASSAKKPGDMSKYDQERLKNQERIKELHEITVQATMKLSNPKSTEEDREEAVLMIQQATEESSDLMEALARDENRSKKS